MYNATKQFLYFSRTDTQLPLTIVGIFGLLLNLFLVVIILLTKTKLGSYKHLLLAYTIIGFLSLIIIIFSIPILIASDTGAYAVNTVRIFSKEIHRLLLCLYLLCYNCWFIILAYSFLYRCVVVRNKKKRIFNRKFLIILCLPSLIAALASPAVSWIFSSPPPHSFVTEQAEIFSKLNVSELSFVGSNFFNKDGSIGKGMLISSVIIGTMVPVVAILIACTVNYFQWYSKRSNLPQVSKKTIKKQHRLFVLLILQTITPVAFAYIPPAIGSVLPVFGLNFSEKLNFIVSVLLYVPQILDPIWIIFFVTDYRRAVFFWNKEK